MSEFNKRISQKVSKLSKNQIEQLFESLSEENEMFSSILDSLATGLIILDKNWKIIASNKASDRYIPFTIRLADSKLENLKLVSSSNLKDLT